MREQMEEHTAQERRLVLDCAMQAGSILLKNGAEGSANRGGTGIEKKP